MYDIPVRRLITHIYEQADDMCICAGLDISMAYDGLFMGQGLGSRIDDRISIGDFVLHDTSGCDWNKILPC